jgi:hypothetical protein
VGVPAQERRDGSDFVMQRVIDLANAGDIAGAEAEYARFAHPTALSGHDRQTCERAIAQAKERAKELVKPTVRARRKKRISRRTQRPKGLSTYPR